MGWFRDFDIPFKQLLDCPRGQVLVLVPTPLVACRMLHPSAWVAQVAWVARVAWVVWVA